jgi:hypothetical protein
MGHEDDKIYGEAYYYVDEDGRPSMLVDPEEAGEEKIVLMLRRDEDAYRWYTEDDEDTATSDRTLELAWAAGDISWGNVWTIEYHPIDSIPRPFPYANFDSYDDAEIEEDEEEDFAELSEAHTDTRIPKMQAGKAKALLAKSITFRGNLMTKGQMVEAMVRGGAVLKVDRYPKYQFSRTIYNRLDGQAQRDYEEKMKTKEPYVAEFPDGVFYALTQTEAEYFLSIGGKPS